MKRFVAALFLVFCASPINAQYLNISPQGLTSGSTPIGGSCTSLNLFYNNAGTLGCMSGTSWDDTNRSLTITGPTLTGSSAPILNLSQAWNNPATQFHAFNLSVVATNYAAGSTLFRLRNNVTDRFSVGITGNITATGDMASTGYYLTTAASGLFIQNANAAMFMGVANDVILGRKAAANRRYGAADAASAVAQTESVQGIAAGNTDVAGANWTRDASQGTGAGAGGSHIWRVAPAGASGTAQNAYAVAMTLDSTKALSVEASVKTTCTTVTGLGAAGIAGRRWCVTDQLTACPVLGGTFTNGGSVVCSAFDDGTNWTHQ